MRKLIFLSFVTILSLFLIASLNSGMFAATTGKIQGTIIDAQSKEPLPGVNVIVEGTTMGAATDDKGYFFILNVPPGTYQLKSSIIGYTVETISDVRVYVDRTTTQDFQLRSVAIAGQEVTVTATRVPVPLDVSTTQAYISGQDVVETATSRFDQLVGLQAGVVFDNTGSTRGFSVRGGDVDETDVQIDGLSLMNRMTRQPAIPLSRNLVQDVQILSGGFNAEYGNVRSGLVNIITKDGSFNRYSGVIEGRYMGAGPKNYGMNPTGEGTPLWKVEFGPDALAGITTAMRYAYNDQMTDVLAEQAKKYYLTWGGWTKYAAALPATIQMQDKTVISGKRSPEFCMEWERWLLRDWEHYAGEPDLNIDVGIGGPVPKLGNTKFYISHFWNKSQYMFMTSRVNSYEMNESVKLSHRISSNMNFVASGLVTLIYAIAPGGRSGGWGLTPQIVTGDDRAALQSVYSQSYIFQQAAYNPIDNRTYNTNFKFTHTVSPKTYYEVNLGANVYDSDKHPMRHRDDKTPIKYIHDTLTNLDWPVYEYPRAYGYEGLDLYGRIGGRTSLSGNFETAAFPQGRGRQDNQSTEITFSGNFVSQLNKTNQLKAGFNYSWSHLNERSEWDNVEEYSIITEKPFNWSKYIANYQQLDWFVQNKLEWEGMIVNAGLRGTSFFPGVKGFNLTEQNMYSGIWQGSKWGSVEYQGNWQFAQNRTRDIKTRILLQPRFGISHPITESSKIFFNYGHFYNPPGTTQMFMVRSSRTMGGPWGTGVLAQPDLEWPLLVQYEIGYSQSIYNQFLLQISGYYKDYTNNISTIRMYGYYGSTDVDTYANMNYRDVRGLEFRVERSFGRFINGWANYNYMIQSSGTTGITTLYEDPLLARNEWATATQTRPSTIPTFRLSLSLRTPIGFGPGPALLGIKPLSEWRASIVYTWVDGGERLDNSSAAPKDWRYVNIIDRQMVNLDMSKRIAKGANFYVNVQNLLDLKRYAGSTSGDYYTSLHLPWEDGAQKGNDNVGEWKKAYIAVPFLDFYRWSPEKRTVYLGIRYQF